MTLSFLGNSEEARKIYNFCGSKSGRDLDKAKETGLTPVETDNVALFRFFIKNPTFDQRHA